MAYTRTIVCLANSIKHYPSRCIAGKEWGTEGAGGWLRPVDDYRIDEGAIKQASSLLQDGMQPQILDILQIQFANPVPHGCQKENHLILAAPWQKKGKLRWTQLDDMVEIHHDLWGSGNSSRSGINDRLSQQEAACQQDSLRLVRPGNLRVVVSTTGAAFNNPKKGMRAKFNIGRTPYNLKITDPRYTEKMREYDEGVEYPIENSIVSVSISEPLNSYQYKLIATIFMQRDF
jgi:hypothetical protein